MRFALSSMCGAVGVVVAILGFIALQGASNTRDDLRALERKAAVLFHTERAAAAIWHEFTTEIARLDGLPAAAENADALSRVLQEVRPWLSAAAWRSFY